MLSHGSVKMMSEKRDERRRNVKMSMCVYDVMQIKKYNIFCFGQKCYGDGYDGIRGEIRDIYK